MSSTTSKRGVRIALAALAAALLTAPALLAAEFRKQLDELGAQTGEDYDLLKSRGQGFVDTKLGAAWRWTGTDWWSYDSPETAVLKADYIQAQGLGGAMWWELSGDEEGDLIDALASELRAGPAGPVDGVGYRAEWWTRGEAPGVGQWGPWENLGVCES